jgi:glucokinase
MVKGGSFMKKSSLVLAGDIGGTKTSLGLYVKEKGRFSATVLKSYPSREAAHLKPILEKFLSTHPASISSACFGIAGPVINGKCKTTNLPWEVSENRLKQDFGWKRVRLVNDLAATALSIPLLKTRELAALNKGRPQKAGNLALVAPGTGLGQGLVLFHRNDQVPVSSEGGHVDFAPTSEDEVRLWRFLGKKYGRVSVERVVSGPGLVDVYEWVRGSGRAREPLWLKAQFQKEDPAEVITDCALGGKHPYCVEALDHFVRILGAVAGNLALTGLATGGVYLCGGIPPKILWALKTGAFMKAFSGKGRFESLLKKIPVRVILNERAAMLGAAACAFQAAE